MKKLLCLIMTAVTIFACFSFTASATESAGILELAEKFKDGRGKRITENVAGYDSGCVSYIGDVRRR